MLFKLLTLLLTLLSLSQGTMDAYVDSMSLGGNLFLVNREYSIDQTYVPRDLVRPQVLCLYDTVTLRKEAAQALEQLFRAAKDEADYDLIAVSGYRSFGKQRDIHQNKINSVGRKAALRVSAPPGCSEHQLGLAVDIGRKKAPGLNESFGSSPEGKWVADNCHRFGFIIRYKAEWEETTGYAYEPWHIRYVGIDHAKRIYEMDIPFEYYIQTLRKAQFQRADEGRE